jgi:hypothetical protein
MRNFIKHFLFVSFFSQELILKKKNGEFNWPLLNITQLLTRYAIYLLF